MSDENREEAALLLLEKIVVGLENGENGTLLVNIFRCMRSGISTKSFKNKRNKEEFSIVGKGIPLFLFLANCQVDSCKYAFITLGNKPKIISEDQRVF